MEESDAEIKKIIADVEAENGDKSTLLKKPDQLPLSKVTYDTRLRNFPEVKSPTFSENDINFPYGCTWSKLPIMVAASAILGCLTTYTIASIKCHVQQFWIPYISYTGNYHPEHMMFGMVLNIESFLVAIVVIVAWRFMIAMRPSEKRYIQNTCSVGIGVSVGLCIVANFQVEKAPYPHYMGAFMAFVSTTMYVVLSSQILATISKKRADIVPPWSIRLRWALSIISVISFISCFLITSIGPMVPKFEGHNKDYKENLTNPNCAHSDNSALHKINGDEKGVAKYAIQYNLVWSLGALFEWINALCFVIFIGMYTIEFRYFKHVKIILKNQNRVPIIPVDKFRREDFEYRAKRKRDLGHRRGHSYGHEGHRYFEDKDLTPLNQTSSLDEKVKVLT